MKVPVCDRLESKNERKNKNQTGPLLQMVERALDGVAGNLRCHCKLERYQQAGEWWDFYSMLQWDSKPNLLDSEATALYTVWYSQHTISSRPQTCHIHG